jgi:hypothetical protein
VSADGDFNVIDLGQAIGLRIGFALFGREFDGEFAHLALLCNGRLHTLFTQTLLDQFVNADTYTKFEQVRSSHAKIVLDIPKTHIGTACIDKLLVEFVD